MGNWLQHRADHHHRPELRFRPGHPRKANKQTWRPGASSKPVTPCPPLWPGGRRLRSFGAAAAESPHPGNLSRPCWSPARRRAR